MASLLVPILYVVIVFGGLWVFSHYYRKHTASQLVEPYFGPHAERNTYISLLQMTDPPAPDALLKAALLRRAVADVHRIVRIREDKPAIQMLMQKGSVGDDLLNSLLAAESELQNELVEVVQEANSFVANWGNWIFPSASEVIANERTRALLEKIPETRKELESKYGGLPKISPATSPSTTQSSTNEIHSSTPSTDVKASGDGESSPQTPSKSNNKTKKRK